jgi:NAD(P)-dependent dehydrogenase (short-subunit alcohol dehydrogenase family)
MRLRGKVALLTGAAAHLFVCEGAKVVLTDIRDELDERAADS